MGNINDTEEIDANQVVKNKLLLNDNLYFGNEEDTEKENKKRKIIKKLNKKLQK